jgi:hypothetical protein
MERSRQVLVSKDSFGSTDHTDDQSAFAEDTLDAATEPRPTNVSDALLSAISHTLTATTAPVVMVPRLMQMGQWLGFTEHEVMKAIGQTIENDPEPSLGHEELSRAAAEQVSAIQLVDAKTVHIVERMPMLAGAIPKEIYFDEQFACPEADEHLVFEDVSAFLTELPEEGVHIVRPPQDAV